jgi:hypothetical protein
VSRHAKPQTHSLLIPCERSVPQHLGQPQPLRLPSVEYPFDYVRGETGEREQSADVGVRDALLLRKVGDRPRRPALDPPPPAVRPDERLDQRLVAAPASALPLLPTP